MQSSVFFSIDYSCVMTMQRVMIFIDGSNFYHGMKDFCGKSDNCIDFYKFSLLLAGNRHLMRTYYYSAPIINDGSKKAKQLYAKQQKFFSKLRQTPYLELKLGRLHKVKSIYTEKGVDTAIAIDVITMAYKNLYDVAVLLSADGDLAGAIQSIKDMGKHAELGIFKERKVFHLKQVCDRVQYLNDIAVKAITT